MWIKVALAALMVLAVGAYIASRSRYYGRMFSKDNFRAFHEGLSRALEVCRGRSADVEPNLEDGSAFVTGAGLAIGVTCSPDEEGMQVVHISMSQPGGHTTRAVCSRFGFFAVVTLGGDNNKAEITLASSTIAGGTTL